MDPTHPQYPGDGNEFKDAILNIYKRIDEAVGKVVEAAGEGVNIFLVSDHGAGALHKTVNINIHLMRKGFLYMNKGFKTRRKMAFFKLGLTPTKVYGMLRRLHLLGIVARSSREEQYKALHTRFLSFDDVDWERTKAFSRGHVGQIFITAKGKEYEKVRDEVAKALYELVDPETKERAVTKVLKKEEVYGGRFMDQAPDLFLVFKDYKYVSYPLFASSMSVFTPQIEGRSGHHKQHGIFYAVGPDIKKGGRVGGARLIDIAPVVLHTFGLPIPGDMDGRVLRDIYAEGSEPFKREPEIAAEEERGKVDSTISRLKLSGKI
jgi:predicted AlkP superfamily phosphohydrolase/phosphomutase